MFYGTYKLMMARYPSVPSRKTRSTGRHDSVGRQRTCKALLTKSDRLLADMGFSRELLEQGMKAWPWRVAPDLTGQLSSASASVIALEAPRSLVADDQWISDQRQAA